MTNRSTESAEMDAGEGWNGQVTREGYALARALKVRLRRVQAPQIRKNHISCLQLHFIVINLMYSWFGGLTVSTAPTFCNAVSPLTVTSQAYSGWFRSLSMKLVSIC